MFPFPITKPKFQYPFGVKVLPEGRSLLIQSESFSQEIELKKQLLSQNPNLYYQLLPEAQQAAEECAAALSQDAKWVQPFEKSNDNEACPLKWIGRQVQEDLLLIDGKDDQFRLIGGIVCFPSGWSVEDKIGQSMSKIHAPVPSFEDKLMKPTAKLLGTLKVERPVWRVNWGLRPSDQLDQSLQYSAQMDNLANSVTPESAGESCFFRLEYQTLSRLPKSEHIVFTIHTRNTPLKNLPAPDQKMLLSNLETCPEEILKYKGIWPMVDAVKEYLKQE